MQSFRLLCLIVFVTLAFEFTNGWHDAASSIATVVSTRVMRPSGGGHLGCILEFRRGVCLRHRSGQDHGKRAGSSGNGESGGAAGRVAGRNHLELRHDPAGACPRVLRMP